jgi:hypothetical protein
MKDISYSKQQQEELLNILNEKEKELSIIESIVDADDNTYEKIEWEIDNEQTCKQELTSNEQTCKKELTSEQPSRSQKYVPSNDQIQSFNILSIEQKMIQCQQICENFKPYHQNLKTPK